VPDHRGTRITGWSVATTPDSRASTDAQLSTTTSGESTESPTAASATRTKRRTKHMDLKMGLNPQTTGLLSQSSAMASVRHYAILEQQ
jgi:hypothetical protein